MRSTALLPYRRGAGRRNQTRNFFSEVFKLSFDSAGRYKCSLSKALDVLDGVLAHKEHFIAIVFDFASRVGNQLEAWLINPLGRALFDQKIGEGAKVIIQAIELVDSVPTVELG